MNNCLFAVKDLQINNYMACQIHIRIEKKMRTLLQQVGRYEYLCYLLCTASCDLFYH